MHQEDTVRRRWGAQELGAGRRETQLCSLFVLAEDPTLAAQKWVNPSDESSGKMSGKSPLQIHRFTEVGVRCRTAPASDSHSRGSA